MFNEVTVLNVQEKRPATPDEIKQLIEAGSLFINYYIHFNDTLDDAGKVFIDLKDKAVGKFTIPRD